MKQQEIADYEKAGKIAKLVVAYSKELIKPEMLLLEIAQKIHTKIIELGGKPAFPVNLSIDDVAAHYHPILGDETKATGLLKVDIGVHINGFVADTAFSIDLTPNQQHKEMIEANEKALDDALKIIDKDPTYNQIGETIQTTIKEARFSPVVNLSGHGLEQYEVHAGDNIPNYANGNGNKFPSGAYAIEPFVTTGDGKIYEGPSGNIYALIDPKNVRSPKSREILNYIIEEYQTLPFSLREMQEKFGPLARLCIKQMVQEEILHEFSQLIEISHKPVSQSEHTFIKDKTGKIIITTK